MRTPTALITLAAAGLLVAGCSGSTSTASESSTPPVPAWADTSGVSTVSLPPLTAADEAFLASLERAGLPQSLPRSAVVDAELICATLSRGTSSREDLGPLFGGRGGLPFVHAAADNYCPDAGSGGPTTTPTGPVDTFGEGTYVVGDEIEPGTYRTSGPAGSAPCYWARLSNTSGEDDIVANDLTDGPTTVTIKSSDEAFESHRCGQWTKTG